MVVRYHNIDTNIVVPQHHDFIPWDDPVTADIVLVNNKDIIMSLEPTCKIITQNVELSSTRDNIYYMNNKIRDNNIIIFKNDIKGTIKHIDITIASPAINTGNEIFMALYLVGEIVSWETMNKFIRTCIINNGERATAKGDVGVHFDITVDSTASSFFEKITVTTWGGNTYVLKDNDESIVHYYHQRYGASVIQFITDVANNNKYHQRHADSIIMTIASKNRRHRR